MRTAVKLPAFLEPRPRVRDYFLSGLRLLGIAMLVAAGLTTLPILQLFAVCGGVAAVVVLIVALDTRALKQRQRAMREEILFSAWLEGVNRIAVQHGYNLTTPTTRDSIEWRQRWARGLSPEEALADWWLIPNAEVGSRRAE